MLSLDGERWWGRVEALLNEMRPSAPAPPLLAACDALWGLLKEGMVRAGREEEGRRKNRVLAAVGAMMERKEAALLLRLSRLVLAVCGPHEGATLGACKLAFKLSKSELNDSLFRELVPSTHPTFPPPCSLLVRSQS